MIINIVSLDDDIVNLAVDRVQSAASIETTIVMDFVINNLDTTRSLSLSGKKYCLVSGVLDLTILNPNVMSAGGDFDYIIASSLGCPVKDKAVKD